MATQCENCGKELFAGQRFCRYCGRPSGQFQEESIPTQMMPHEADPRSSRRRADTSHNPGARTEPVYTPPPQPGYYEPSIGQPPAPPPYMPPRKRSAWGWIVALVSLGLLAAMFLGIYIITRAVRNRVDVRSDPPPEIALAPGESRFGEEGASVSGRETVITRTFVLTPESRFSINNSNGEITVEGWDQPQAEVRIVKRGGSRSDRSNTEILYDPSDGNLKLRTANRARGVEVRYEVKLPRTLKLVAIESASGSVKLSDLKSAVSVSAARGDIEISDIIGDITLSSANGDAALSDINGKIAASTARGSIELNDITGSAQASTASGDIKADFDGVTAGGLLEFSTASGDIEIALGSEINADLDVETVSGDIRVDERFNIPVEKEIVGQRARGRIGAGGQRVKIKTTSGDVRVTAE
ncbi:MAG TPA: DUF4097 family beta strand repeat-containing protein [Blastocatellia bacterium]|nr:DUF4097 family beta strand repeat-containing protein [Blastocatellia bacterium]